MSVNGMYEKRFVDLADFQQERARARFVGAGYSDGYWYLVDPDGTIISRNQKKQSELAQGSGRVNIYRGIRTDSGVQVSVNSIPLDLCRDVHNHSSEFEWGYGGSGPAQLALAIFVCEYGKDLNQHPASYQDFKWSVIAGIDQCDQSFTITSAQVRSWVDSRIATMEAG